LRSAVPSRGREVLYAALFFLGWTALATWPQVLHLGGTLSDYGDAKLVARILQWDFAQTLRDPGELFHLNFFHPARYVLAFSENLYGVSLFGFPLLAAGASAVLNYNVLLLLGMALSALGAWALAREITGDPLASVVAGVVYAFLPWRAAQIPHLQFQWGVFLCLTLLFLVRYLEEGRRRDLVLYAVAFGWNALANVHFALFSGFLVAVALAWGWLRALPERGRRTRAAVFAAALAALPFLPFAAGYRAAERLYGFRRHITEIQTFSGRWTDFLSAGDKALFWGPLTQRFWAPERHFFPGALAIVLAATALVILWLRRPPAGEFPTAERPGRGRLPVVWIADIAIAAAATLWFLATVRPRLSLGPLRLHDPGRILVLLVLLALVRLAVLFPGRRFRNLADFLRRMRLEPRAALLLAVAATGILIAFGINTPFYRVLIQSFGVVFRAIRAPSRGIVLFHIALAVFAAWGLSFLVRRRPARVRLTALGVTLAVLGFEYRVFPLPLLDTPGEPSSVYRWMRAAPFPGAAVEWPLGLLYDWEYVLRQAAHEKPILNGYSGFFPLAYTELDAILRKRPIPESEAWPLLRQLGATVLVYHAHEARGFRANEYSRAVLRGVEEGRIELVGSFPHEGLGLDFVYRLAGGPAWTGDLSPSGTPPREAARLFETAAAELDDEVRRQAQPFAGIEFPGPVSPGQWHGAWALDDSGIAEVRISSERGEEGSALLHMRMPGLAETFPDYDEAKDGRGGFGFPIPDLPPGRHVLTFTLIANDGGRTVIQRTVEIRPR
jgi:hypothetical protein